MTNRIGIRTSLKNLRHYSATELIAGGVDARTVAGRLGHAGGGATTLRVYTAWVSESDQRAAGNLAARMPQRQGTPISPPPEVTAFEPSSPFEVVAASLRDRILDGSLERGQAIPPVKQLAHEHGVAVGTVQRAVALLKHWGLVDVLAGRRTVVRHYSAQRDHAQAATIRALDEANVAAKLPSGPEPLDLEIRKLGQVVTQFRTVAAMDDYEALQRLLTGAVKRDGGAASEIDAYEMAVRRAGEGDVLMTFVLTGRRP